MECLDKLIEDLTEEIDVRPKRVIKEGFQEASRLQSVKQDLLSRSERKRDARRKREATTGAKWFDMPIKELTAEDKLALDAIRLRDTLDPTKFYKKKATDNISKNFQIGTVIEHPIDYYTDRAPRKECKETLVDELIADAEFKKNVKRRYGVIKKTDAIRKREKALAERRRAAHAKKKAMKNNKS